MMENSAEKRLIDFYLNNLEILHSNTPDFVNQFRSDAIESFKLLGLPDKKVEKYKYTPLKAAFDTDYNIHLSANDQQSALPSATGALEHFMPDLDAYTICLVNGSYASPEKMTEKNGVVFGSLAQAMHQYPDIVEAYYNTLADNTSDAVTALNTAFVQDGAFIYAPAGSVLDKPIKLINILTGTDSILVQPRNLFIFSENTQATVLMGDYDTANQKMLTNSVSEIFIDARAQIEWIQLQDQNKETVNIASVYSSQHQSSVYFSHTITLNGSLVRNNIVTLLQGEYCENYTYGLTLGRQWQHIDHYTFIHHAVPNCMSNELFKTVLDEQAVGVFNGRILVQVDAQKTQAFQKNNNLLLSDSAKVYTKPQLEIYADDVKCTHGATVGQLDEDVIFYMRSRGISPKEARMMQMYGFMYNVLQTINSVPIRETIMDLADNRLRAQE